MSKRDFYEVLGVNRDADDKTIKSAYRKLAMLITPTGTQMMTRQQSVSVRLLKLMKC